MKTAGSVKVNIFLRYKRKIAVKLTIHQNLENLESTIGKILKSLFINIDPES